MLALYLILAVVGWVAVAYIMHTARPNDPNNDDGFIFTVFLGAAAHFTATILHRVLDLGYNTGLAIFIVGPLTLMIGHVVLARRRFRRQSVQEAS